MKRLWRNAVRSLLPYMDDPDQRDYTDEEVKDALRARALAQLLKRRKK